MKEIRQIAKVLHDLYQDESKHEGFFLPDWIEDHPAAKACYERMAENLLKKYKMVKS